MRHARTVLLTGAAGRIGTVLRERLPALGWRLRCYDRVPVETADGAEAVRAELADAEALRAAMRGADAVVHLAARPGEGDFPQILDDNVMGTYHVYEAARAEGVRRVVAASSNHAVGFVPVPAADAPRVPVDVAHRPDTYYGLSKCFGEDLAQLYWDRLGIETVSLRIGACFPEPRSLRDLTIWLSPGDCARLVDAALTAPGVGHTVVYGCSANTRGVFDLSAGEAIGFRPVDDSEAYAARLAAAENGDGAAAPGADGLPVGGAFATRDPAWPEALRERRDGRG